LGNSIAFYLIYKAGSCRLLGCGLLIHVYIPYASLGSFLKELQEAHDAI